VNNDAVVLKKNEVRTGRFTAPPGTSLRDPLTFPRSAVSSVQAVKSQHSVKVALWVAGLGLASIGVFIFIGHELD
jgi:hypothetical protein